MKGEWSVSSSSGPGVSRLVCAQCAPVCRMHHVALCGREVHKEKEVDRERGKSEPEDAWLHHGRVNVIHQLTVKRRLRTANRHGREGGGEEKQKWHPGS